MRNTLQSFRRAFEKLIGSESFNPQFHRLRESHPQVAAFRTPADLIAHQHTERLVSPDQKDRVLHTLVRAYQQGNEKRSTAEPLLFLSMYPALARVYRQTRHLYGDEGDCAAEVRIEFLRLVAKWNPDKHDRVAANLWMSTRRNILRRKATEKKEEDAIAEATTAASLLLEEDEVEEASASHLWSLAPGPGQPFAPDDIELRRGIEWLRRVCGISAEDAALLFARHVCRLSWKAISEWLGMKPESARKKAGRLAEIVRRTPNIENSCPGFGDFMCVPLVEGKNGRTLH
jgi:hypothetical protein